jgi:hemolysin III
MKKRRLSKDGSIYVTDEIINTSLHIIGAIFSILGLVILVVKSSLMGDVYKVISFSIYGLSLTLMFIASSLHHGITSTRKIEKLFRFFDYISIFPLIAGTFTPICLVPLRGPMGWSVFGVIWGLAAISIVIRSVFHKIPKWAMLTIYIGMGWIGAVVAVPLFQALGIDVIIFLALGGLAYTVGAMIFYFEKPNPVPGKFGFHEIWHIFVLIGAFFHYMMMYYSILPS